MSCASESELLPGCPSHLRFVPSKVSHLLALNEPGRCPVMTPLMWPVLSGPSQCVGGGCAGWCDRYVRENVFFSLKLPSCPGERPGLADCGRSAGGSGLRRPAVAGAGC